MMYGGVGATFRDGYAVSYILSLKVIKVIVPVA
jgi:hypothetical protein